MKGENTLATDFETQIAPKIPPTSQVKGNVTSYSSWQVCQSQGPLAGWWRPIRL